ncbi:Lipid A 3-O-deacylase (PagL) [Pricia antarctica]|uniref:Lipid A 3-O-deacylase (PagL) n=1 Tax=Pricia antarctica TaxID=641691 RepID=A0A1G7GR60_9FLAO|nr:acyloxyacyl hydrolase [Pricia antarctica]SDE90449.1 Lipid A 3-O-deacylase (PagL) [Pricia antarctica]
MSQRVFLLFLFVAGCCFAQEGATKNNYSFDANTFYGSIYLHNPDISHLITAHPAGLILGYSRKTYGREDWQQGYNYPDLGASFIYQDMVNPTLGKNYSLYAHFNFYFFKRNLQFRIGQGIAYTTNPYDRNTNFRNNAYGSRFLSSSFMMFNYHKENIYKNLGFKTGISIIHYSNANVKAPNTSTNTIAFNAGLVYTLEQAETEYIRKEKVKITEPIKYNLVFRGGANESDNIGHGQYPFFIFSGYADKRLGRKSAVQAGADVFFSNFLKELIEFQSIAFPENNIAAGTDYKRVGLFVGHELFINKLSIITQLGYYVYYPFDFEGRVYNRLGLKRYFGDRVFGVISLKSHGAAAEAVEFGIGVRL